MRSYRNRLQLTLYERKGKERKGKERKGKEMKWKERKGEIILRTKILNLWQRRRSGQRMNIMLRSDTHSLQNRSQSVHGERDHTQNRGSLQKRWQSGEVAISGDSQSTVEEQRTVSRGQDNRRQSVYGMIIRWQSVEAGWQRTVWRWQDNRRQSVLGTIIRCQSV